MAKKQKIMDSAVELFATQGFEATSVQQITEKAGISKGAFYLSFKSKDELISSLLDQFLENLLHNFEQVVSESHDDANLLFEYCILSFKNVEKNMQCAHLFIQEASSIVNSNIVERLQAFHFIIIRTLQTIIARQFPHIEQRLRDELVFTVNALVKAHTEQMLLTKEVGHYELVSRAIEEKISILAQHMIISTMAFHETSGIVITLERLLALIDEKIEMTDDSIGLESLQLLRQHLVEPSLSPAIEAGILHNLHAAPSLKYIAYMYEIYKQSDI